MLFRFDISSSKYQSFDYFVLPYQEVDFETHWKSEKIGTIMAGKRTSTTPSSTNGSKKSKLSLKNNRRRKNTTSSDIAEKVVPAKGNNFHYCWISINIGIGDWHILKRFQKLSKKHVLFSIVLKLWKYYHSMLVYTILIFPK